ncbi:MAG: hypothetical protein NWF13_06485 [Candidatus Bathyarchaeota archaeon]|nr:hypothetical protein [Candidatus Bathyarchaeota archaeon]
MERRQFQGYNCDLIALQEDIEIFFAGKGFRVTNFHKGTIYLTQIHKNELGAQSIFIKIVGVPTRFEVSIGMGETIKNINHVPSSFEGIPFSVKLILGELRLESDFWNFFSTQAQLNRNTFELKKRTSSRSQPLLREREIIREIEIVYCNYCGTKNVARRTSCLQCGGSLR